MKNWNIFHVAFIFGNSIWILDFLFKMNDKSISLNEIAGYALVLFTSLILAVVLWKAVDKWTDAKAQTIPTNRCMILHNIVIVLIIFEWVFFYMIAGNSAGIFQYSVHATEIFKSILIGIALITICTAIFVKFFRKE